MRQGSEFKEDYFNLNNIITEKTETEDAEAETESEADEK